MIITTEWCAFQIFASTEKDASYLSMTIRVAILTQEGSYSLDWLYTTSIISENWNAPTQ